MTTSHKLTRAFPLFLLAILVAVLAATGAWAGLEIVWGPVLGDLTSNSAQLAWYTNLPCMGYVDVGVQKAGVGGPTQVHKVMLKGLEPGTDYQYRLVVEIPGQQVSSPKCTLHTPAVGFDTFTFCAYSDTQEDAEVHARVVKAMMTCAPAFILCAGDLVEHGASLDDWHSFFPVIAAYSATVPIYPCLGNHEGNADQYYNFLPLPAGGGDHGCEWYSTIYGSCQIISLDSEQRQTEQETWLRDLLAQPRPAGVRWRIVEFHRPCYTSGPHPPNTDALKHFCPYLEAPGAVDLVCTGHNHYYERSLKGALNYVGVASAGGPIYHPTLPNPYRQVQDSTHCFLCVKVTPDSLEATGFDTNLKEIDHFTVTK